jgi:polysaccharide deacetylase family protein (PEP-CTERM system associated)
MLHPPTAPPRKPANVFSVDVEDFFQVEAFSGAVSRDAWDQFPSRVVANTHRILDMLDDVQVKGTFFVLGWVARRHPQLVREIASRGHEIASHGMSHRLIYRQTPEEFREETVASKALLEDQCQQAILGYRAATYSITNDSLWALDTLVEAGFVYDSSIFPVWHDKYGIPDAPRMPHRINVSGNRSIVEFPISILEMARLRVPVAGGGYFRFFPYAFTKWAFSRINREAKDFVFYMHPWEIDPDQPRIANAGWKSRFRHYLNLHRCEPRLRTLLRDFPFTTMRESLRVSGLLPST